MTNAPHLMKRLAFGFNDFEYVCQVFENIFTVSVAPQSKVKTLPELVELARANPDKLTYGTAGVGSLPHLTGEGFAQQAGITVTHVPFRGDGQVIPSLLGGQIDFSISGMGSATENLRRSRVVRAEASPRPVGRADAVRAGIAVDAARNPGHPHAEGLPLRDLLKLVNRLPNRPWSPKAYQSYGKRLNKTGQISEWQRTSPAAPTKTPNSRAS